MKRILVLCLVAIFVLSAATAFATIANTRHNLTTGGLFGTKTTDASASLCGFCHIPHGGDTSVAGLPIWARDLSGLGGYTLYGGGQTLAGTTVNNPTTYSLTCLSCHDGTIGLGTVTKNGVASSYAMTTTLTGGLGAGGEFQATNIDAGTGYSPYIGTDLQNDHPIGFVFPAGGYGAGGGVPGITITVNGSGTPTANLTGATSAAVYPLFNSADTFECATCHDPHLEDQAGQTKFLRGPNADLCQDCHDSK
jgi:predicted CXXCH cytochrome family protein